MCCILTKDLLSFADTSGYYSIYVTVIPSDDGQHKRPILVAEHRKLHVVGGVVFILIIVRISTKCFVGSPIFTERIPTTCSDHTYDPQESPSISFNLIF